VQIYRKEELGFTLIHISMAAPPDLWTLGRCSLAAVQKCTSKNVKTSLSWSFMYAHGQGESEKIDVLIEFGSTPLLPFSPRERSIAA
jgi:hypothetical protein